MHDPKQQRFFTTTDLHELFTLGDAKTNASHGTETAAIFAGSVNELNKNNFFDRREAKKSKKKRRKLVAEEEEEELLDDSIPEEHFVLSEERIKQLKELAKKISM